ncbi:MAG: hypothetical protein QHJ73_00650 [Armatimonadota bacterium]|nr:hypothetical protein [Armatimonadota bacterium]
MCVKAYRTLFAAACVLVPGFAAAATEDTSREGFQPLLEVTLEDEPWSGALVPEEGPPRGGHPTVALRWPVDERPAPDSPPLLSDWSAVEAVRFWLHLDEPCPYRLAVLLTGRMNGYWLATIPLNFSGWRQFTLAIEEFRKVRDADLKDARSLSFRAQGYGQPELRTGMVWWVDAIEVRPRPGAKLPRVGGSIETNLAEWEALGKEGNPYYLLNARRFQAPVPPFQPPAEVRSAWQYRTVAEELVPLAFAAADSRSPHRGRADLVARAIALTDWLVEQCRSEGWWWRERPPDGDPNVNRFTLAPLLDGIRWLRQLPEGEAAWTRWRERLDAAVQLQKRAYRAEEPWDWGGLAGGAYVNQDAYYILIMALSARLYGRPADQNLAASMMRRVAANLLPDGGLHYIGQENESPVYHALNLVILGRYARLSGDPTALRALKRTANYWPLTLTAEGQPEYWSDVWWKQSWGYVWRDSLVIAAGATGDARNRWLMWRALERSAPTDGGMGGVYAAEWWPGMDSGKPLPTRFVVADRNMRGLRGRTGQWYFGVTAGRGLRNTFVGGLVTAPRHPTPLLAAFRGAQIHVLENERDFQGRWLSEANDRVALAFQPNTSGALGVRYTLQPSLINGVPTPKTPPSVWQVTQVWRAGVDGCLGMVALEATADAPAIAVAGRIGLGPRTVKPEGENTWRCGPLRVKILHGFGTLSPQPVPGYNMPRAQGLPGLEMLQPLTGGAKRGERFVYALWVGPESATPPDTLRLLPGDAGWVARWSDGRCVGVLYNPGRNAVTLRLPWPAHTARAYVGEGGKTRALRVSGGTATARLEAGECMVVK